MKRKYLETLEIYSYTPIEVGDSEISKKTIEVEYEIPTKYMYKQSMEDKKVFQSALEDIRFLKEIEHLKKLGDESEHDTWSEYILSEDEYMYPSYLEGDDYLQTVKAYTYSLV